MTYIAVALLLFFAVEYGLSGIIFALLILGLLRFTQFTLRFLAYMLDMILRFFWLR